MHLIKLDIIEIMSEAVPIQKEFGEIERLGNHIKIKKLGTERQVGQVTLLTEDKPIPHLIAYWLWVGRKEQGKGFGSQLMEEVEKISHEQGKPVVLADGVKKDENPHAVGMYARRDGWTEFGSLKKKYVFGNDEEKVSKLVQYYAKRTV